MKKENTTRIEHKLVMLERKVNRLNEIRGMYTKRMLKFGAACWIFGLSTFFFTVILSDASQIGRTPHISLSLLMSAAAAPILITALCVRKFGKKIERLKHMHHKLQTRIQIVHLSRTIGEIKPLEE